MTSVTMNAAVVLQGFGPYQKGQLLTDPSVIAAILSGGHASMIVRTQITQAAPESEAHAEEH